MPFAMLHRDDVSPALIPLAGFEVHQVWDAEFMARLQGRAVEEMSARFDAGHRAYVAWRNEEPAAWGWVATTSARIGELDASFMIAARERYLWNFVTLPAHRGLGIYPRLLQASVTGQITHLHPRRLAHRSEKAGSQLGPDNSRREVPRASACRQAPACRSP